MLEAYSFENVLERGFAVVQTPEGALITDAGQTSEGQAVNIRFRQNKVAEAVIGKGGQTARPAPKKKKPKKKDEGQASLF